MLNERVAQARAIPEIDAGACLNFLSSMVRIKSYSQTEGEGELARFMVAAMRGIGLDADLQKVEGERCNAIGRWRGRGGGKTLLFNGHIDTNPVGDGWTVDPWAGKVDQQFIYGIGVSNMKAGDAAYFCAVKTLLDAGVALRGDVLLTYVVGELQGGVGTIAAIEQGLQADYFINCEPTDLQAVTMHAASCGFEIDLWGVTRHLSKREEAIDAIAIACELIPRINALTFPGALTEEHRRINRAHVGVVRGALGDDFHEWRPPQVADHVRMKGSLRYAPGQTEEQALQAVREILQQAEARTPGLKTSLRKESGGARPLMPPFEVSRSSPVVQAVNRAYRAVRGSEQPTGAIAPAGFYGTDAGHLSARMGIDGLVCGPGGRYNTMPDERVDIDDYLDMIRIYMHAIVEICG